VPFKYAAAATCLPKGSLLSPRYLHGSASGSPLAPILSARDDTFTIRSYGDARDKSGNVIAKAWCEATVRRTRDFVDPADAPDITTAPTSAANQSCGRRFQVISFRWLSPDEV